MTPKSAKAKGRRLAQGVADAVSHRLNLSPVDVQPTSAGVNGNDLRLSQRARVYFPFDVEAKNQERLNIWEALDQVEKRNDPDLDPLVVFTRNRADTYVAMRFDLFMDLVAVRKKWLDSPTS